MDESYIDGTVDYIWYVTVIHTVYIYIYMNIKCGPQISNSPNIDIEIYIKKLRCHIYDILSHNVNILETT